MRSRYVLAVPMLALLMIFVPFGFALEPISDTVTIDPLEFDGWPLLNMGDSESVEINIESDKPVNIYIVSLTDIYQDWASWDINEIRNRTLAEDTYEGVMGKQITKDYDYEDAYAAIVFNPSLDEPAEVTIEYEFWTAAIAQAAEKSVCGTFMVVGTLAAVGSMALIIIVKRS
jgi:hypothetical protein